MIKRVENLSRNIFTFDDEAFLEKKIKLAEEASPSYPEKEMSEKKRIPSMLDMISEVPSLTSMLNSALSYLSSKMDNGEISEEDAMEFHDTASEPDFTSLHEQEGEMMDGVETSLHILDEVADSLICRDIHTKPSKFLNAFKEKP